MAADSIGTFRKMFLVNWERMSTSRGNTWLKAGINNTSSNVRPWPKNLVCAEFLLEGVILVAMCKDKGIFIFTKSGSLYSVSNLLIRG
jgi:hypothetical protein